MINQEESIISIPKIDLNLQSSLCDYSDAYILVKRTIINAGEGADDAAKETDERNKSIIFKNCAIFITCISEVSNTQVDDAKYLDVVMSMHNFIEYGDNYSKTSGSLWQYYRNEPNNSLTDSKSFNIYKNKNKNKNKK